MNLLQQLFAANAKEESELLRAIEEAVLKVDPLLKQIRRYPNAFRKPVQTAFEYAHSLALSVPSSVAIDLNPLDWNAYVHAIFSSRDMIMEAFQASRAIQDYLREHPSTDQAYALMGMRRFEKTRMGMELSGEVIQRDVPQQVVYFTSHTIVDPAPTEAEARGRVAWGFFNNLVNKVAKRIALRKEELQSQLQEMDLLKAHLHTASAETRPALKKDLSRMLSNIQATTRSLDFRNYLDDFEAVLLNPEQHLRLDQSTLILDSMGIRRESDQSEQGEVITFNDLIGFDRRNWTVTMVHCRNLKRETFAERLETAYRQLSI
jgi:hypothetical protein